MSVFENETTYTVVAGSDEADSIVNSGNEVSISAGAGRDTIINNGNEVTINADYADRNTITSTGNEVIILGGTDRDTITNSGRQVIISGGAENDSITNTGATVSIAGGADNDFIENTNASNVTIAGGAGDDSIKNNSSAQVTFQFGSGDGNDIIEGFNDTSQVQITSGTLDSVIKSNGYDLILTVGNDSLTLAGAAYKEEMIVTDADGNILETTIQKEITGTERAEVFNNIADSVTIDAGAGNDSIGNTQSERGRYVSLMGGAGDDTLFNYLGTRKYVTLDGGDGNDSVNSSNTTYATLSGGAGNDSITNWYTDYSSISGGTGDDSVLIWYGSNITVGGGAGNDTINNNSGSKVTFQFGAGDGSDSVYGFNDTSQIQITDGTLDSLIKSDGYNLVLTIGNDSMTLVGAANREIIPVIDADGNDIETTIQKEIHGTNLADTIHNISSDATIDAGAGNDSIRNDADGTNSSLVGSAGKDRIENYAAKVTMEGGTGDDTVYNGNNSAQVLYKYAAGDGNDSISGFNATSTLQIGGGSFYRETVGSDVIVTVGEGKITLRGAASLDTVNVLGAEQNPLLVQLTENADNYKTTVADAQILAFGGDDSILAMGDAAVIDGGAGNDSIRNYGDDAIIEGYTGNDSIRNYGDNATIEGGAGNDSIRNYGENALFLYEAGDGNDVIQGFDETSTLSISGGTHSTQISGSNVIVTVGDNSITLRGAAALSTLNISGEAGEGVQNLDISNTQANQTLNGGAGNDTITNWSGGRNSTINAGAGNDSIKNTAANVTFLYNDGNGNDFVTGFYSSSTLKIGSGTYSTQVSGSDVIVTVGEGKITLSGAASLPKVNILGAGDVPNLNISNTQANQTLNGGAGNDTITNWSGGRNSTINGGTGDDSIKNTAANVTFLYNDGDGNDFVTGFYSSSTLSIGSGTYSTQVSGSDVIVTVGEGKITLSGAASLPKVNILGAGDVPNLNISNTQANQTLNGGAGNDTITNWSGGRNSTINGGTGDDSIKNTAANVTFLYNDGDGNDFVTGFYSSSTLSIGSGTYSTQVSGSDVIVTVGEGTVTLSGAASLSRVNISGTRGENSSSITSSAQTIDSRVEKAVQWAIDVANDSIHGYSQGAENATASNPYTGSRESPDYDCSSLVYHAFQQAGFNIIDNWHNNPEYIARYDGEQYSGDADTIWDDLSADGGWTKFTWAEVADNLQRGDILCNPEAHCAIYIGDGLTAEARGVNNPRGGSYETGDQGGEIDIYEAQGRSWTEVYRYTGKTLTLDDSSSDEITLPDSYTSADASARTKAITIVGNSLDNTIIGGAGNDSLWGGSGADTFLYNEGFGKDIIYGFDDDDMLQITGDWSASYYSGSGRVGFKVGNTYSAIILDSSTASTFNINGEAYQVSGNTLAKKN